VLDTCSSCGGFFLDGGELDLINEKIGEVAAVKGRGYARFINEKHLPLWLKRIRSRAPGEAAPTKGLIVGAETSTPCPACDGKLSESTLYGVKVDSCATCGGMWLDQGELKALEKKTHEYSWREVALHDDPATATAGVTAMLSTRSCPRCADKKMFSTSFADTGVIIDFCAHCRGVWLDQSEFAAINDYVGKKIEELSEEDKKKAVEGLKGVLPGQEGELQDEMDAKKALDSLLSIRIFEEPTLLEMMRHRL
jgi:Zn-finger nucleic acid-binding protein